MYPTRVILPALALAGAVVAQSSCSTTGTLTIQNSGDATALAACTTYAGSVALATSAAGQINLDGVQAITGDLSSEGATNLTGLSANDLEIIGGTFTLNGLTILSTLSFPALTQVNSIMWEALPALQQLSFASEVQKASSVEITNTQLNSLNGINLQVVDNFNLNNNPYLTTVDVQLGNVTQALQIYANGKNLTASFPNLEWAYNMTFRNCSDVLLPSLASINGSMGFYENYFSSFSAPNLTSVAGGSLAFVANPDLTNISLPVLTTVGGAFQIANNSELNDVDGFPDLKTVVGALDFSGNFSNVSLPSLSDVRGGFNLQTSSVFDCSTFDSEKNSGIIKGTYVCNGSLANPGTAGSTPTSTASGSSASATKKSAAASFNVNTVAVMSFCSFVAYVLHWLL